MGIDRIVSFARSAVATALHLLPPDVLKSIVDQEDAKLTEQGIQRAELAADVAERVKFGG